MRGFAEHLIIITATSVMKSIVHEHECKILLIMTYKLHFDDDVCPKTHFSVISKHEVLKNVNVYRYRSDFCTLHN